MSNRKEYSDLPINDQLKDLGVTRFVRHSDLVQIVLNDNQVIYFNIHPKQLQQTMERFRESAGNGTAGLPNDIIDKMKRLLVNPNYDYATNYLRLLDDSAEKEGHRDNSNGFDQGSLPRIFSRYFGPTICAVKIHRHLEVLPLKSSRFKNWLCKIYYAGSDSDLEGEQCIGEDRSAGSGNSNNGTILNTDNLTNFLRILEAEATFGGNLPRDLQLRVAKYDNIIYYDLTNSDWQVVKITPDQVWTIKYSPILFRRYSHQLTQVYDGTGFVH